MQGRGDAFPPPAGAGAAPGSRPAGRAPVSAAQAWGTRLSSARARAGRPSRAGPGVGPGPGPRLPPSRPGLSRLQCLLAPVHPAQLVALP